MQFNKNQKQYKLDIIRNTPPHITVGFRVPADPWGSNTGVHAVISPPTFLHHSAVLGSKLRKEQHKRHRVYTGSGHHCGVIPYSSVWCVDCLLGWWWWTIQGRTALRGSILGWGDELLGGVQPPLSLSLGSDWPTDPSNEPLPSYLFFVLFFTDPLLYGWLILFIEALVLSPNIEREGSQQWRANLKGDSKYQLSWQK